MGFITVFQFMFESIRIKRNFVLSISQKFRQILFVSKISTLLQIYLNHCHKTFCLTANKTFVRKVILQVTWSYSTNLLEEDFRGKSCQDASHHCPDCPIGDGVTIHRHLHLDNHYVSISMCQWRYIILTWWPYRYWNVKTLLSVGRML